MLQRLADFTTSVKEKIQDVCTDIFYPTEDCALEEGNILWGDSSTEEIMDILIDEIDDYFAGKDSRSVADVAREVVKFLAEKLIKSSTFSRLVKVVGDFLTKNGKLLSLAFIVAKYIWKKRKEAS